MRNLILLFLLVPTAHGSECVHSEDAFRCVKYLKNYDADTITVEIPGVHPLIGHRVNVRIAHIDTPEIRTKNVCEREAAQDARFFVESILRRAKRIDLLNVRRDKYFRILADVEADGLPLAPRLLKEHFAYAYDGGTKKKHNWCAESGEHLLSAIRAHGENLLNIPPRDFASFCSRPFQSLTIAEREAFYVELLAGMIRFESNYEPNAVLHENPGDIDKAPRISRGLFQLGFDSVQFYQCGVTVPSMLHTPAVNVACGVRILNYWVGKDKVLATGKRGGARYWAVLRDSPPVNLKNKRAIQARTRALEVCRERAI